MLPPRLHMKSFHPSRRTWGWLPYAESRDPNRDLLCVIAVFAGNEALPLAELRDACRARGLSASGSRSDLVGRLAALAPQAHGREERCVDPFCNDETIQAMPSLRQPLQG